MVYRVKNTITQDKLEQISEILKQRYPEYEEIRANAGNSYDADTLLLERGIISENELLQLYAEITGTEPLEEDELISPEKFTAVKPDYLLNFNLLPCKFDESEIELLAASPHLLLRHADEFQKFFGLELHFQLARRSLIERLINSIYLSPQESQYATEEESEQRLRQLAGDAKIVRLVNEMLSQALEQGASDIHVEPEEMRTMIRFRVDGILHNYLELPLSDYPAVASRIKLIGNLNIAESRLPQDGRTNFQLGSYDIDIRISTIPVMKGESIVMRLLRKDSMRFDLSELGMSSEMKSKFETLIEIPHGIILVVGPTGSGKTTTLYSVMNRLNNAERKIITVEDPVEYQLPGLSQMQINHKIGLNFASGLRHIVRQDPDVILVGEIRDKETAEIAINAALTGHLVLSTLHTNDAVGAITRLQDMGVESFLISSVLCGVLSQRLARKVCKVCDGSGKKDGTKCKHCNGSGFKGRTGVYELLLIDDELRGAINNHLSGTQLLDIAVKNGMVPLLDDGLAKVEQKITTKAEILRIAAGVQ